MSSINLDYLEANDNCAFFEQQRDYEASLMHKYNLMLLAVGIAVTASLVGLVISVAIQAWGVSAATGVGTVVSGTAVKFIFDRKNECQSRIDKWVQAIQEHCP